MRSQNPKFFGFDFRPSVLRGKRLFFGLFQFPLSRHLFPSDSIEMQDDSLGFPNIFCYSLKHRLWVVQFFPL
jgi:hypothetical protein